MERVNWPYVRKNNDPFRSLKTLKSVHERTNLTVRSMHGLWTCEVNVQRYFSRNRMRNTVILNQKLLVCIFSVTERRPLRAPFSYLSSECKFLYILAQPASSGVLSTWNGIFALTYIFPFTGQKKFASWYMWNTGCNFSRTCNVRCVCVVRAAIGAIRFSNASVRI